MKKTPIILRIGLGLAAAIVLFSLVLGVVIIVKYNGELKHKEGNQGQLAETTLTPTATPAETPTPTPEPTRKIMVCIDPGSSASISVTNGLPASTWTKTMADRVRDELVKRGYDVVITNLEKSKTFSEERAKVANDAGADIFVSLQADSHSDASSHGVWYMYPDADNTYMTAEQAGKCDRLGLLIKNEVIKSCVASSHANGAYNDLDIINKASMPAVVLELGYMSNKDEDTKLWQTDYQKKMAEGICNGIDAFFSEYPVER